MSVVRLLTDKDIATGGVVDQTIASLVEAKFKEYKEKAYPVGYIIMSTTNTNPSTYLGIGTWVAWGSGKVPVGVDTASTEFKTVEQTGGSKTHSHTQGATGSTTLTTNQIPAHSHTMNSAGSHSHTGNTMEVRSFISGQSANDCARPISSSADHYTLTITHTGGDHTHTINNAGGGQGHTHTNPTTATATTLQPYITCYMWKRTK